MTACTITRSASAIASVTPRCLSPAPSAGITTSSVRGVRIGVLRRQTGYLPQIQARFAQAQADLMAAGAVLVGLLESFSSFWASALSVVCGPCS